MEMNPSLKRPPNLRDLFPVNSLSVSMEMNPSHKRPPNFRPLSCKLLCFCCHGDEPHKRDPIFRDHFCCKQSSIPLKLWDATVAYACTFSLISHYHVATGLCNVNPSLISHYHFATGLCNVYSSLISHYHFTTGLCNVYSSQISHFHFATGLCSGYPSQISHYHVSTVLYNYDPSLKSPIEGNNLVAIFCVQGSV